MAKAPSYITLKYHKDNFRSAHPCRLINPCKNRIGKISKSILETINIIFPSKPVEEFGKCH